MAILTAYPGAIDIISVYLIGKAVFHKKYKFGIYLESIPLEHVAYIKHIYYLSENMRPNLLHYLEC